MKISLIIFDCDGVLLETEFLSNQHEAEALQKLGYSIPLEEYIHIAVGRNSHHVEDILKEKHQINLPSDFWEVLSLEQKNLFEKHLTAVAGIVPAIESISTPLCIASNSKVERLRHTLGITGLLPFFEGRIFSADHVKRGKPFPDLFFHAAQQMKTPPSECIVIEDSLAGIEGGLAAGMTVLAFGGGKHITSRMKDRLRSSGAYLYFDRMQDLPQVLNQLRS